MMNESSVKTKVKSTVRLVDIAMKAGVSRVAAARVLLNSGQSSVRVSEATAEKVRKIALEMNYSPNIVARQLAGKRSKVIGVIIDSYAPLADFVKLSEMEREAAVHGYRFMVGQSHGEFDRISAYAQDFADRGIEGIICISHQYPELNVKVPNLFSRFENVVYISKPYAETPNASYIHIDVEGAIQNAFHYLVTRDRKHIALLLPNRVATPLLERLAGYTKALADHGMSESLVCHLWNDFSYINNTDEQNEDVIKEAIMPLVQDHGVDAILTTNDIFACMTIRALRRLNLRVPQDISVIGYDNLQLGSFFDPRLTTIDQRPREQAQIAINLLMDMIAGREISPERRCVVLKPELIIRESA